MIYATAENRIIIEDLSEFNIQHILDCGQVFRYRKDGDCYTLFAKNYKCLLRNENGHVIIENDNVGFFVNYFDLNRDYNAIKRKLTKKYAGIENAVKFGKGIRLLNQDPFETVISFIISANNNIPRIKKIIEALCRGLGEKKDGYYAFPAPEAMANADLSFYSSIGAGYRAEYLYKASRLLANFDMKEVAEANTADARKKLLSITGVGKKVADCILLFAFKKTDLFPMDTWSKKIYASFGYETDVNIGRMSARLVELFGDISGYAQQYLYYYYRENKIVI